MPDYDVWIAEERGGRKCAAALREGLDALAATDRSAIELEIVTVTKARDPMALHIAERVWSKILEAAAHSITTSHVYKLYTRYDLVTNLISRTNHKWRFCT